MFPGLDGSLGPVTMTLRDRRKQGYVSGMKATKAVVRTPANAFAGFTKAPSRVELEQALGASYPVWQQLLAELALELGLKTVEWNTSAPKRGWTLRVKQDDRIIIYLAPLTGSFHACFVLGDRALRAALAGNLPSPVLRQIRGASKCAVGTGIRIDVREAQDIAAIKKLAEAKLKH